MIVTDTGYVCPLCWATFGTETEATEHEREEEAQTFEVSE